jgi:hypothetical protein
MLTSFIPLSWVPDSGSQGSHSAQKELAFKARVTSSHSLALHRLMVVPGATRHSVCQVKFELATTGRNIIGACFKHSSAVEGADVGMCDHSVISATSAPTIYQAAATAAATAV